VSGVEKGGSAKVNRKIKTTKPMSSDFPYETYRGTKLWKNVDRATTDLAKNGDLVESTRRDYVVGFICKKLEHLFPKTDA
jgi:hypothetical protein